MKTAAINLRVNPSQRDLIDYAASLLGKARSDFMLEAAYTRAQNVILDRTLFPLDEACFNRFTELLEQPVASAGLEKLMAVKAPWEK